MEALFCELAERVIDGEQLPEETLLELLNTPDEQAFELFAGANRIRRRFFGQTVHLCTICNAKSGKCSENCSFCSQSAHHRCEVPEYALLEKDALQAGATYARQHGVNRYSLVTSGKGLPDKEVDRIATALCEIDGLPVEYCCSLGILSEPQLQKLRAAGVTRYHHNLEAAESFFDQVCTTHTYADRVATIRAAQAAGMSVCSGGLFGLGESDRQVVELGRALAELKVDAVPINFLTAIEGTRTQDRPPLAPLRCLKIIAVYRYLLRDRDLLICGGRANNLRELQSLIFHAGASGMMTGNYLTVSGRAIEDDLQMIRDLGMTVRT
jgi:biotin synthase